MGLNISGADMKRFWSDKAIWGEEGSGTYVDDTSFVVDGVVHGQSDSTALEIETLPDTAVVQITSGYLVDAPKGVPEDLVKAFKFWLKRQTMRSAVVEVPIEKMDELKRLLASLGGKVLS